jgi:hypothetical protein
VIQKQVLVVGVTIELLTRDAVQLINNDRNTAIATVLRLRQPRPRWRRISSFVKS